MLIVESQSLDVYRNLAIEEYLMDEVTGRGPILFLWRSDRAVVIGKNQNPWRECRLDLMGTEGIPLARRISGGGAVYHDEGNLNYCIIVDRTRYQKAQAYEMVINALESLGVHALQTGRSNLSAGGFKFSGNAFCFRKNRALHHGTLLLDTSLKRLSRYLGSMFEELDTRAIASEPAEVTNLKLDLQEVSSALGEGFEYAYSDGSGPEHLRDTDLPDEAVDAIRRRLLSDEWRFDVTPSFTLKQGGRRISIEHGVVTGVEDRDETLLGKRFSEIADSLVC